MTDDRRSGLIEAWLDATIDDAGLVELEAVLLESAEARQDFWRRAAIHGLLREAAKMAYAPPVSAGRSVLALSRGRHSWLRLSRMLGAAAILIGGCGLGSAVTSFALAYSGLLVGPVAPVVVHEESFEFPPAPESNYLPTEFNVWGGDETEVVEAERGIVPCSGSKMLRFVSSHPRGKAYEGNASEIWRVLDLDELRIEGTRELRVDVAASFNSAVPPGVPRVGCLVGAIATDVHPAVLGARWRTLFDTAEIASTRIAVGQRCTGIDDDPATWQRLSATVTVPSEARYLVIYCLASTRPPAQADSRAAEYIDDITVTVSPLEPQVVAAAPPAGAGGIR